MTTRPLIAVVDDDRIYTEMIRDFLDGEGYDTILILDAATAVETIVHARPGLVLLDIRMDEPESGVDVLTTLRSDPDTASLPIVVCTADQQFLRANAEFLESQHVASLAKPFDLDALLAIMQRTFE